MAEIQSIEKQGKRVKELAKKVQAQSISMEEIHELSDLLSDLKDKVAVLKYFYAKNNFEIEATEIPDFGQDQNQNENENENENEEESNSEAVIVERKKVEKKVEEQPAFSFSLFGNSEEEQEQNENERENEREREGELECESEEEEEEAVVEKPVAEVKAPVKEADIREEEIASNLQKVIKERQTSSLNDNYFGAEDNSLASKMQHTPIANLKSAIGINIKFTFINELFKGDSSDFSQTVEAIDHMSSADDARALLSDLSIKYSWDLDQKSVAQFVEMVERRFF